MNLLQGLEFKVSKPVRSTIDHKTTTSLAKNLVLHGRSKHIDTHFNFMRNQVHNGVLEVIQCNTQKQLADLLTKIIKTEHFINSKDEIGFVDF